MSTNRRVYLDFLRIISIFFVIVNHTVYSIILVTHPSAVWFTSVTYLYVSKVAVPLFLMISGAVLLGKDESYKDWFFRFLRVLIVTIGISFLYFMISPEYQKGFDLATVQLFFGSIYQYSMGVALWYLYLYLGILLMLPILRKMVRNFAGKDYIYYFVLSAIFGGILPVLTDYFSLPSMASTFILPIFNVYILYFIIGYYIDSKMTVFNKKARNTAYIVFVGFVILSVMLTYIQFLRFGADKDHIVYWENRTSITIILPSICIFYLAKYFSKNSFFEKHSKKIVTIGKCVFGIYLISDLMIYKLTFINTFLTQFMHPFASLVLYQIILFLIGFVIIYFIRKIPFAAKYL